MRCNMQCRENRGQDSKKGDILRLRENYKLLVTVYFQYSTVVSRCYCLICYFTCSSALVARVELHLLALVQLPTWTKTHLCSSIFPSVSKAHKYTRVEYTELFIETVYHIKILTVDKFHCTRCANMSVHSCTSSRCVIVCWSKETNIFWGKKLSRIIKHCEITV